MFLVLFTWFPQFFSGVEDVRVDSFIDQEIFKLLQEGLFLMIVQHKHIVQNSVPVLQVFCNLDTVLIKLMEDRLQTLCSYVIAFLGELLQLGDFDTFLSGEPFLFRSCFFVLLPLLCNEDAMTAALL
jgi:hypothetical protein